ASLVAGTKYRGDFETKMKTIINEVRRDGSIILFIDEIHTLVGAGGAEGAINASNILKPFLSRGEIQVIGATTFDEYQKYLEKDPALARRFQRIKVGEPNAKETLGILQGLKSKYEEFHNVNIEADALKEAVDLSVRYISNRFLPDKAIDVMDEACSAVKIKHNATEKDSSGELKVQIADLAEQKQNAVIAQDIAKAGQLYRQELQLKAKLQKMLQQKDTSKPKRPLVTVDQVEKVVSELTGVPVTK
ncbi:MAG: AAA family ATPase, partial [Lactobacillus iners]|nr:AAA family ATPase [Lactobacillus iners]